MDPRDKRLAVQTEDHPLEYLEFEDVIPEGNYGAGPMIVWDSGTVVYLEKCAEAGEETGKLDFLLFGHKLRGRFALVRTGKPDAAPVRQKQPRQWLLLKKPDDHARTEAEGEDITQREPHSVLSGLTLHEVGARAGVAERLLSIAEAAGGRPLGEGDRQSPRAPMLCSRTGAGPAEKGRLYELKLDGVRIIAERDGDAVSLRYRSGRVATPSYPEVVSALRSLVVSRCVLDGEIVTFDEAGRPSFELLAPRIHARQAIDVERAKLERPVQFVAFDMLQLGPFELGHLPLVERKRVLAALLPGRGRIWALDHLLDDGRPLLEWCRRRGLEGIVAKLADGAYHPGPRRTRDWVKIKCGRQDEFVVVGWVAGRNSREGFGALELGSFDGQRWVYRGRVGSGFSERALGELWRRLGELRVEEDYCAGEPIPTSRPRFFAAPRLVVSVSYLEWTREGRLRMAVFQGLRDDLEPLDCRVQPPSRYAEASVGGAEEAEASLGGGGESETLELAGAQPAARVDGAGGGVSSRGKLSNLDKIFWHDEGFTKGDLLDYYAAISDALLPYLRDRPVMLVRYPDGVSGKSFYQWNIPQGTPEWVRTLSLRDPERDGKRVESFLIDGADALLHVINLGCIPVHVLACRQPELEHCDFLTIDLDLGEQPFSEAVRLMLSLRELLAELGLAGYPKTSGQTGLHVLIPLGPGVPFASAKAMVELIGRILQARHPKVSTMLRRVSERQGRIYIDTGQTGRSRTIVAPYSVRAFPGATVSTPLYWEEVHMALDPRRWTMFSVPSRVAQRGDPLQGLLDERPDISGCLARMEGLLDEVG